MKAWEILSAAGLLLLVGTVTGAAMERVVLPAFLRWCERCRARRLFDPREVQ